MFNLIWNIFGYILSIDELFKTGQRIYYIQKNIYPYLYHSQKLLKWSEITPVIPIWSRCISTNYLKDIINADITDIRKL